MELAQVRDLSGQVLDEVERAIVGKRDPLELVLLGFLADGHVLLEDYPGLAKTLAARSFSHVDAVSTRGLAVDLLGAAAAAAALFAVVFVARGHGQVRPTSRRGPQLPQEKGRP